MNFKESRAIYLQIADRICDDILLGQYEEEGRISSVREYASIVEVNANTVMRSYEYLQSQELNYFFKMERSTLLLYISFFFIYV